MIIVTICILSWYVYSIAQFYITLFGNAYFMDRKSLITRVKNLFGKKNKNTGVSFFLCHFFSFSIIWIISVPTYCVNYGLYLYRGLLRLYCEKWSSDIWRMNGADAISFDFRMSGYAMVGNFVLCYFSLLYLFIFMLFFCFIIFVAFFIVVISLGVWIGDTKNEFNHCTVIDCKTVIKQRPSLGFGVEMTSSCFDDVTSDVR